jgi:hypothetical protein
MRTYGIRGARAPNQARRRGAALASLPFTCPLPCPVVPSSLHRALYVRPYIEAFGTFETSETFKAWRFRPYQLCICFGAPASKFEKHRFIKLTI